MKTDYRNKSEEGDMDHLILKKGYYMGCRLAGPPKFIFQTFSYDYNPNNQLNMLKLRR